VIVIGLVVVQIAVVMMEAIVGQFVVHKAVIAVGQMVEHHVVRVMEVFVGDIAVGVTPQPRLHLGHRRRHNRHPLEMLMLFVQV